MANPILLVEDTPSLQMVYEAILQKSGFEVDCAFTAAEGQRLFAGQGHRVVLLDLLLPDRDGLDLMADILAEQPEVKVIVITANGSINRAVSAMRGGAFDFLVKPFDDQQLISSVENALTDLRYHEKQATPENIDDTQFHGFVGTSKEMQTVYQKIGHIGRSMATVFITGESGTGKELCAEAIHAISNRSGGPFVPLDCGAIPGDSLESEVFGHLKGSFAGAIYDKTGAAAAADGGTLFLDEICEMDMAVQTKLLRFLQTSTIHPVGAARARKVDVRIICATNRDPIKEVEAGRFREDLFYRLHVVPVHLPPLRMRGHDAIEVAQVALARFSKEEGKSFVGLSRDVQRVFAAYPWPGNVRQVMNVMRNAVVLNDAELIDLSMLAPDFLSFMTVAKTVGNEQVAQITALHNITPMDQDTAAKALLDTRATMVELERRLIEAAIARYNGSVPRAARHLDLSPSTIYRKRDSWL